MIIKEKGRKLTWAESSSNSARPNPPLPANISFTRVGRLCLTSPAGPDLLVPTESLPARLGRDPQHPDRAVSPAASLDLGWAESQARPDRRPCRETSAGAPGRIDSYVGRPPSGISPSILGTRDLHVGSAAGIDRSTLIDRLLRDKRMSALRTLLPNHPWARSLDSPTESASRT